MMAEGALGAAAVCGNIANIQFRFGNLATVGPITGYSMILEEQEYP
jgi:hypothetical protein